MPKTHAKLLMTAYEKSGEAHVALHMVWCAAGAEKPVSAAMITPILVKLREATAAVTELERRAQGGAIPAEG